MNNPNPFLVPQGVFLDQKNKARTRLKIAVYFSISLSVMVLMVLLIQGCKKPTESTDNGGGTSDSIANTETQQLSNPQPEAAASNATAMTPPAPESNPAPAAAFSAPPPVVAQTAPPPPPVAEMQEYTIVKGDLLSHIASNNHVSTRAILDANPGIDPKRLKIGQKIKIPAPTSSSPTAVAPMGAPMAADTASGAATYKVKSGDTLTTIAKKNHVSIKAIQSANNLGSSTSIKVGQVLKIPGTAAPAPAPEAAPVPPPVAAPAPMH